jgi:hypothetical protein
VSIHVALEGEAYKSLVAQVSVLESGDVVTHFKMDAHFLLATPGSPEVDDANVSLQQFHTHLELEMRA